MEDLNKNFAMFMNTKKPTKPTPSPLKQQQETDKYYQPPFVKLEYYDDEEKLRNTFESLKGLNLNYNENDFKNASFFIIRSKKIDDIHKSMKYGVWTSSSFNNIRFNKAFNKRNGNVYFFFTSLTKDFFVGVAKMKERVDLDREFAYWGEIGRWRGLCRIEWLFSKDLPFKTVDQLQQNGNYIDELKDGWEISWENARILLNHFFRNKKKSCILQSFHHLDSRELKVRNHIDTSIQTGMIDIYKNKVDKKKEQIQFEKKRIEDVDVCFFKGKKKEKKKKLTKKQLKELKSKARNGN